MPENIPEQNLKKKKKPRFNKLGLLFSQFNLSFDQSLEIDNLQERKKKEEEKNGSSNIEDFDICFASLEGQKERDFGAVGTRKGRGAERKKESQLRRYCNGGPF